MADVMTVHLDKSQKFALLMLVLGASAIAFAPIFVRKSDVGPTSVAFWRLFISAPFFILWIINDKKNKTAIYKNKTELSFLRLSLPGFFFCGDLSFYHWALKYTSVANATLFSNFAPIFVTFIVWRFFRQKISRLFLTGLLTSILGAMVIMKSSFEIKLENLMGDILGIISAVFYAGYIISVKETRAYYPTSKIMAATGIMSFLLLIPIFFTHERFIPLGIDGWAILLSLALVSQIIGQGLIAYALYHLPAEFSSVTLLLQPALAALYAWFLLGEKMIFLQICGGILVLIGIRLAQIGSAKKNALAMNLT